MGIILSEWQESCSLSPALRNGSRINMANNLLLRHALSQSPLPLAGGLFLKLAEKLVRMRRGGAKGAQSGSRLGCNPNTTCRTSFLPLYWGLQTTEQKTSVPFCFSNRLKGYEVGRGHSQTPLRSLGWGALGKFKQSRCA